MSEDLNFRNLFFHQLQSDTLARPPLPESPEDETTNEEGINVTDMILRTLRGIEDLERRREELIEESSRVQQELLDEARSSEPSFVQQVDNLLDRRTSRFSDPEAFTLGIQTFLHSGIQRKMAEKFPNVNNEQQTKLTFLYTHYDFVSQTIEEVVRKKQPHDKHEQAAKWVVNAYFSYVVEGTLPDVYEASTQDAVIPEFGTPQQWMDLCDSLQQLYKGKPDEYIRQMITLTS